MNKAHDRYINTPEFDEKNNDNYSDDGFDDYQEITNELPSEKKMDFNSKSTLISFIFHRF
jgi:hypothetical protein